MISPTKFLATSSAHRFTLYVAALLGSASTLFGHGPEGNDWPQWRGPDHTGISNESEWSPVGQPEALWRKDIGLGHSSFAVASDYVYTLGYDAEAGLDSVYCFDVENGDEIWRHQYPSEIWDVAHDGGALTTPTIVGDLLYSSNREAKVFCFERATGKVVWSRDLRADMDLEPPTWGYSGSPLVVRDRVFLNVDRLVALDRYSGENVWVTQRGYGNAYSTATPFEFEGQRYLALLNGDGLALLDRGDGSEVDFYDWAKEPGIYPMSPVVIGDRIFISAGYERGCAMLQVVKGRLAELWGSRAMRNKMSGSVLFEDHLYGFDESILKCIDLDGKERWRQRGLGTGSMSIAGGRLLILDGRGQIIVAEATPEAYVELSRRSVLEGGTAWSTPVLANGRVYCRSSLGQMAVLDYRGSADASSPKKRASNALPTAEEIVARHVEAVGGLGALDKVTSVRMVGESESLINTVRVGDIELVWRAGRGFDWSDAAGLQIGHNAEHGWLIGPRSSPALLEDEELDAVREAGDLTRLFDPSRGYASMTTADVTIFEGRECHVVSAETQEGYARTLYFEVESGLFAGHQGEGVRMWTLTDYREFDGVWLPTRWSIYEPVKGEHASATFRDVSINADLADELFAVPEALLPFLRTPEELARDTERLTLLNAQMIGTWHVQEDPEVVMGFQVVDGFFAFTREDRDPAYLSEPDETGRVFMLGAEYVTFTPEKADDGSVEAIQIRVGDELRDRLVRADL